MTRTHTSKPTILAATTIAAALMLGGCWDFGSRVSVIPADARSASLPIESGAYCTVSTDFDDAGEPYNVVFEDCFEIVVDGGDLIAPWDDEGNLQTFQSAPLGRGAYLLESFFDEEEDDQDSYLLAIVVIRDGGVALLPELRADAQTLAAAEAAGVVIEVDPEDVAAIDEEPVGLFIVSGDAEAAFNVVRNATGRRFDDALRDPEIAHELLAEATYYIPVEGDAATVEPDRQMLLPGVEDLRDAIMRAMTLE